MDRSKSTEGKKVLLVEADQWVQNLLRMFFRFSGCHLEGYANGAVGLDAAGTKAFDIVVSDYWLPDMDGLSLLAQVKERQGDGVFILITAYPTENVLQEAARLGIDEVMEKPLTIEKLGKSLERLLSRPVLERQVSGSLT